MKILFLESGGIWPNNLARGFQAIGHDVIISGPIAEDKLSKIIEDYNPDLAITIGWGQEHTKEKQKIMKEAMNKNKIPLLYWAVEDPAYTERWSIPLVTSIQPDFVFTLCPNTVDIYKEMGIPAAHLDFGFEETVHYKTKKIRKYRAKIAVVANAYPNLMELYPEHFRLEALNILIRPLLEQGIRVDFWGKDWEKMYPFFGMNIPTDWIHGPISYTEANKIYSSADITIGLQNYPDLLTQRTYEVLGSSGCLLTMDTPAVNSMFRDGKEVITSKTSVETVEKIKFYLKTTKKRNGIRKRGRSAVKYHSYKSHAIQIIKTLVDCDILSTEDTLKRVGNFIYIEDQKDFEMYTVQKGDSLYGISQSFDISIDNLKEWNAIKTDVIYEHQTVKVRRKQ